MKYTAFLALRIVLFNDGGGYVEHCGKIDEELAALLKKLSGAEMILMAPGMVTGKFAGIEEARGSIQAEDKASAVTRPVLKLVTQQGPESIPVSTIRSLRLVDEKLQEQLQEALDRVIDSRKKQLGTVEIHVVDQYGKPDHFTAEGPARKAGTLIPIVRSPIKFERVKVYNPAQRETHAACGAYLTNKTDSTIRQCEIRFFEGGKPAGRARIEELAPGSRSLVRYADDPEMTTASSQDTDSKILGARITKGVLDVKHLRTYTRQIVVTNSTAENLPVIVEHPFSRQRRIVEPDEFEEKTDKLWRFRFHVYKQATRRVAVKEEQLIGERVDLLSGPVDSLLAYSKNKDIPKPVRDALTKTIQIKAEGKKKDLAEYLKHLNVE